jgi:hypothetical protein
MRKGPPTEARAALAGSLLESLDTDVDEDAEAAWATEVNRRVAELDLAERSKRCPGRKFAEDSPRADGSVRGQIPPSGRWRS